MDLTLQQKREIIEDWIKRLRSGEYEQTKGRLRTCNGYCCLGVLMESINEILNIGRWVQLEDHFIFEQTVDGKITSDTSWVPSNISRDFGFISNFIEVEYKDGPIELSTLNDAKNLSFIEIADVIEQQILPKYKEEEECK